MTAIRAFLRQFNWGEGFAGMGTMVFVWAILWVDWRFQPRLERMLTTAYAAVYVVMPLAWIAATSGVRLRRPVQVVAAAVPFFAVGRLLQAWVLGWPKTWALDDPPTLLVPIGIAAALAVLLVVVSGASLEAWGVGLGDWRWWGPKMGLVIAVILPIAFAATAFVPGLKEYYPSDPRARTGLGELLAAQGLKGLGLFAEEFFLHGFLLFALARTHGNRTAILVTSLIYFLSHRTKPEFEMLSSFPGSIVLGVVCLRCRTFLPAFLGHWPLNFFVELSAYLYEGPRTDMLWKLHGA